MAAAAVLACSDDDQRSRSDLGNPPLRLERVAVNHEQRQACGDVAQEIGLDVALASVRDPSDVIAAAMQHPDAAEAFIDGAGSQGKRYAEADTGQFDALTIEPVLLQ